MAKKDDVGTTAAPSNGIGHQDHEKKKQKKKNNNNKDHKH